MENMSSLVAWQPSQLIVAGLVIIVLNLSLGFSLWKALSHSQWTPYWHISSILTGTGAVMLAIAISRSITNEFLVNLSWATVVLGVSMTILGAVVDFARYINFRHSIYNA